MVSPPPKRAYPSREGKRAVTVYLPVEEFRALRVLAVLHDRTMQAEVEEACRALLAAGRDTLAPYLKPLQKSPPREGSSVPPATGDAPASPVSRKSKRGRE